MCVLMFMAVICGTAAVCSEACISMGLEEEGSVSLLVCVYVCVCVCVSTLIDVTDAHSFPSCLRVRRE